MAKVVRRDLNIKACPSEEADAVAPSSPDQKSMRHAELEELKKKQIAKSMRRLNKETDASHISKSEPILAMDEWHHQQRALTQESKKKRNDAEQLLHKYKSLTAVENWRLHQKKLVKEIRKKKRDAERIMHNYRMDPETVKMTNSMSKAKSRSTGSTKSDNVSSPNRHVVPDVRAHLPKGGAQMTFASFLRYSTDEDSIGMSTTYSDSTEKDDLSRIMVSESMDSNEQCFLQEHFESFDSKDSYSVGTDSKRMKELSTDEEENIDENESSSKDSYKQNVLRKNEEHVDSEDSISVETNSNRIKELSIEEEGNIEEDETSLEEHYEANGSTADESTVDEMNSPENEDILDSTEVMNVEKKVDYSNPASSEIGSNESIAENEVVMTTERKNNQSSSVNKGDGETSNKTNDQINENTHINDGEDETNDESEKNKDDEMQMPQLIEHNQVDGIDNESRTSKAETHLIQPTIDIDSESTKDKIEEPETEGHESTADETKSSEHGEISNSHETTNVNVVEQLGDSTSPTTATEIIPSGNIGDNDVGVTKENEIDSGTSICNENEVLMNEDDETQMTQSVKEENQINGIDKEKEINETDKSMTESIPIINPENKNDETRELDAKKQLDEDEDTANEMEFTQNKEISNSHEVTNAGDQRVHLSSKQITEVPSTENIKDDEDFSNSREITNADEQEVDSSSKDDSDIHFTKDVNDSEVEMSTENNTAQIPPCEDKPSSRANNKNGVVLNKTNNKQTTQSNTNNQSNGINSRHRANKTNKRMTHSSLNAKPKNISSQTRILEVEFSFGLITRKLSNGCPNHIDKIMMSTAAKVAKITLRKNYKGNAWYNSDFPPYVKSIEDDPFYSPTRPGTYRYFVKASVSIVITNKVNDDDVRQTILLGLRNTVLGGPSSTESKRYMKL